MGVTAASLHHVLLRCLLRSAGPAAAIDYLIDAAKCPDALINQIPFPWYLLTRGLSPPTRTAAMQGIVARAPDTPAPMVFLARMLSYFGDYAQATALLGCVGLIEHARRAPAAEARPKAPAFLIIGQAKAGTTALFEWLGRHPDIVLPTIKEIRYWSEFADADNDWYRAHFPLIHTRAVAISGAASTPYLTHPRIP